MHRVLTDDIFTPDGRILTRLNSERVELLRKLRGLPRLSTIAHQFWIRRERSRIVEWRDTEPEFGSGRWEERRAIGTGVTMRNVTPTEGKRSYPRLIKGQNIVTGAIVGSPVVEHFNISQADDTALFRYHSVLPKKGWAFCQITLAPCCAPFDLNHEIFDNTATLFFPSKEYVDLPLDLLMASRVYVWIYGLSYRMGLLARSSGRSHLYPTNLAQLPIPADLADATTQLTSLRPEFEEACRGVTRALQEMQRQLADVPTISLRDGVRRLAGGKLEWSDTFDDPDLEVDASAAELKVRAGVVRVQFGTLLEWVEFSHLEIAKSLVAALSIKGDELVGRSELLRTQIPDGQEALNKWNEIVGAFAEEQTTMRFEEAMLALDRTVAHALGFSKRQLAAIHADLASDAVLRHLKSRLPGAEPRAQGFISSLKQRTRYTT